MRLSFILPVALLGLVSAAPQASADMLSVPSPKLPSLTQTVADKQMETAVNDVHLRAKPTTARRGLQRSRSAPRSMCCRWWTTTPGRR